MTTKFTSGRLAIAECDRCGFRFKLKELRTLIIKTKNINIKVCRECWEPDQPQLSLGLYPINDPQAVRDPRPDRSYLASGNTGLQLLATNSISVDGFGTPGEGSRQIQWGWNPVGMGNDWGLTVNNLVGHGQVGSVTVSIT